MSAALGALEPKPRILAAVAIVVVAEVALAFLAAHGRPMAFNLLYALIPPLAVAILFYRGPGGWALAAGMLALLIFPAWVGAELLAHAMGTCLQ
ncbi:MAG: hypothetical protein V4574_02085 [Pseudomonadota bacterium]